MAERIPLYYTFGNHMHWVDMEWLWGYHVLPGSVRDMINLCQEAGVKGCINFDGIGYEKLASEDPEAFAELRAAIRSGMVEVVGGSYGQPYGLFHGGESNVRQRIFGVRTSRRLFGVDVKTFWEEEFDFFPQLPQMLRGVGIEYGSLFFQWTWHTPEVPREDVPVVWWESPDGSRLLCATRNRLNLHQWPEDMDILLAELAESSMASSDVTPLILQWLELMPSPDWMCRSELILPKLRELFSDPRFEVKPVTLGEYLRGMGVPPMVSSGVSPEIPNSAVETAPGHGRDGHGNHGRDARATVPVRPYTLDQMWHGMTLGKNGDNMRRLSREAENSLLSAETLAATAGLIGRPYAQWDVYPTWELEEAWRELLSAQHHDNDECEGLCGYVGRFSYERSRKLSRHVFRENFKNVASRVVGKGKSIRLVGPQARPDQSFDERPHHQAIILNPLGWERLVELRPEGSVSESGVVSIPAFGYRIYDVSTIEVSQQPRFNRSEQSTLERNGVRVDAHLQTGYVRQVSSPDFPEGMFADPGAFGFDLIRNGEPIHVTPASVETYTREDPPTVGSKEVSCGDDRVGLSLNLSMERSGLEARIHGYIARPDPGLNAALKTSFPLSFRPKLVADYPYGLREVHPIEKGFKKYPTGDWMTSPQWFEEVHRPFTSLSLVDLLDADNPGRGVLIVHDGSQQWFLEEGNRVSCILNAYDPWDEDYFLGTVSANFYLIPHGSISNSQRWKLAQECLRPPNRAYFADEIEGPANFRAVSIDAENVVMTAFYRETRDCAKSQAFHAADVLGVDYPYVLRLVEFDGIEADSTLSFGATVAAFVKTNLLGEPQDQMQRVDGDQIQVRMRPYEIATLYLDLVEGRKQVRDLDAKREVWATVHRVD